MRNSTEEHVADSSRSYGNRPVQPGFYHFDDDPTIRVTEFDGINGGKPYYDIEVQSIEGEFVSIRSLLKHVKNYELGTFEYALRGAECYGSYFEIAKALVGHRLIVDFYKVRAYKTYDYRNNRYYSFTEAPQAGTTYRSRIEERIRR